MTRIYEFMRMPRIIIIRGFRGIRISYLMSLKLAAIIPHPPLLIPSIGKENILRLEKTKNSYSKLAEALIAEKIETIVIISSHGPIRENIWSIDLAPEFEINFEEFGDYSTRLKVGGDLELAQNIRESLIDNENVQAISAPVLDHGCGVPLYSLLAGQKNAEIVPLYISGKNLLAHFELGKSIGAQIKKGRKKIAGRIFSPRGQVRSENPRIAAG